MKKEKSVSVIKLSEHWSKPYYGVQHLGNSGPSKNLHWVSVTDRQTSAELTLWTPSCGFNPEKRQCRNIDEARKLGEKWLKDKKYTL